MYLAFNGIQVRFAASLIEELKNEIGDGKTFRFPPDAYRLYETSTHQKKRMGPKGRGVNYTDTVSLEIHPADWHTGKEITKVFFSESAKSQNVRVTYFESSVPGSKNPNVIQYKPSAYTKPGTLHQNEYMKWFYLSVCARTVKGSKNAEAKNSRKRFMIEMFDSAVNAKKEVNGQIYEALCRAKVMAPEELGGLSLEDLKVIGKTMFIGDHEAKTPDLLKLAIVEKARIDETDPGLSNEKNKKGWGYLWDLINKTNVGDMELKMDIQKAIEKGVIHYDRNDGAWFYCDSAVKNEKVKVTQICLVLNSSLDPIQTLVGYMKISPKNHQTLKQALKDANITPGMANNNQDNIKSRITEVDKKGPDFEHELVPLYIELTNLNPAGPYVGKLNKLIEKYPQVYEEFKHLVAPKE